MREKVHQIIIGGEVMLLCMVVALLSTQAASSNPPSNGVSYNKNEQVTVENALDNLYTKANYGNATANDILKGKTALVGGKEVVGTYEAPTLASQTPGDATPEDITGGKVAWVNGKKVVGVRGTSFAELVETGDFISYSSPISSYLIEGKDHNPGNQTIYPNKSTIWEVIRKNEDGTVDIIPQWTSSTLMILTRYLGSNIESIISRVSDLYINSRLAKDARFITDDDLEFVRAETSGTLNFFNSEGLTQGYWLALENSTIGFVDEYGEITYKTFKTSENWKYEYNFRPIVTLKSHLSIAGGEGTSINPYIIKEAR